MTMTKKEIYQHNKQFMTPKVKITQEEIKDYTEYVKGLYQIGQRIEVAYANKQPEIVKQWFEYLQGYIKALKNFL